MRHPRTKDERVSERVDDACFKINVIIIIYNFFSLQKGLKTLLFSLFFFFQDRSFLLSLLIGAVTCTYILWMDGVDDCGFCMVLLGECVF